MKSVFFWTQPTQWITSQLLCFRASPPWLVFPISLYNQLTRQQFSIHIKLERDKWIWQERLFLKVRRKMWSYFPAPPRYQQKINTAKTITKWKQWGKRCIQTWNLGHHGTWHMYPLARSPWKHQTLRETSYVSGCTDSVPPPKQSVKLQKKDVFLNEKDCRTALRSPLTLPNNPPPRQILIPRLR